ADMPCVRPEMIAALLERYRGSGSVVVASDYEGILAPPTLFDRRLFAELQEREGEGCGRRVVERHLTDVSRVSWPPSMLSDLDRPADYQRLLGKLPPG
ncbi:MAG TPA: NTP transferase domain-containing protein, partial [Myxococcaceae bacterium]|nr:NTP transferase domain-containing protein [Myxococcaceae bacterium]